MHGGTNSNAPRAATPCEPLVKNLTSIHLT